MKPIAAASLVTFAASSAKYGESIAGTARARRDQVRSGTTPVTARTARTSTPVLSVMREQCEALQIRLRLVADAVRANRPTREEP